MKRTAQENGARILVRLSAQREQLRAKETFELRGLCQLADRDVRAPLILCAFD